MKDFKVADLCDDNLDKVTIADAIGFNSYGSKKRFGGKIHTLKCFEDHSYVTKIASTDGTGKVLVVDGGASPRCAIVGDKISSLAIKNNWEGIIVYGSIRDAATIATLNLGVLALHVYPISKTTSTDWETQVEVTFAGTVFKPGHFVYVDEDGIITSENRLV
ncbi:ribonuclease E activity regulator RraA [Bizionia arctica]|uniref:4-hydroxy-4-methyl-2-oxoglutarate aldolase n=1 Tax=Bizionia arctica TaxID=1495645 RepID=A0A917GJX2_9FLAO|nr:ribonuclease E activity regulator RraA [Bizionia arctica]GGG49157.1 4-hydroxy-4-methyl-2-oxoglutarate aldolase [Bizionia arctica]